MSVFVRFLFTYLIISQNDNSGRLMSSMGMSCTLSVDRLVMSVTITRAWLWGHCLSVLDQLASGFEISVLEPQELGHL